MMGGTQVNYLGASCGTENPLDYWNGKSATALDMMAYAAAAAGGYPLAVRLAELPRPTFSPFLGFPSWLLRCF